jgi:hydroxymethylpyrimidine/phosphomethylpyrimidine kinase
MKFILSIAGSDSCGGAGIQADIKTITSLEAHALTVLTAVTAQNSMGVTAIHKLPAPFVSLQLESVMCEVVPHALKIGMMYGRATVKEIVRFLKKHPLSHVVLDPLIRATTGKELLLPRALNILKKELLPLATVITPNTYEAGILAEMRVENLQDMTHAAAILKAKGPDVVITGGHLQGDCVDLLYNGYDFHEFWGSRIDTKHTHGSGCVFSTALATFLAGEEDTVKATKMAHDFSRRAIIESYPCGQGPGPVRAGIGPTSPDKTG